MAVLFNRLFLLDNCYVVFPKAFSFCHGLKWWSTSAKLSIKTNKKPQMTDIDWDTDHDPTLVDETIPSTEEPDFDRNPPLEIKSINYPKRTLAKPLESSAFTQADNANAIYPFPEEREADYSHTAFSGVAKSPFPPEVLAVLMKPISPMDIQLKPDGIIYLPEIKYRQILFQAFGAGGWALVPRGPHTIEGATLTREYALYAHGQLVSIARGSAILRGHSSAAASSESARSNALMRTCKDLGIAHELWDPAFIAQWKAEFAERRTAFGSTVLHGKSGGSTMYNKRPFGGK